MKCLNEKCDAIDIEKDDNFCYKCGEWTTNGYRFLNDKNNVRNIANGPSVRQSGRLVLLGSLLAVSFIIFFVMLIIRGNDLFRPYFYLKKQVNNYFYGYNTTLMNTTNIYNQKNVESYEDAISFIKKDLTDQDVFCFNSTEVSILANKLEDEYLIPSVSLCDMSLDEANKIKNVIDKIYSLFPNIKGSLTNITITNNKPKDEYIARFQPLYQFININEKIEVFNKVNKTQILLNSYYFLNEDNLNEPLSKVVGEDWYVKGATWESTIAHEFGHYVSFVTLLRKYNVENITFVTKDSYKEIDDILNEFNSGAHSDLLLKEALDNYNNKYNLSMTIDEFALTISKYAASKDKDGNIVADEVIAEAVHDYFIHGDNMKQTSREIINVLKSRL